MTQTQSEIVQVLSGLLAAEQRGILHHLGELGAFVGAKLAGLSRPLAVMAGQQQRNETELGEMIESLGGLTPPLVVNMEMQTLAFLSVDYLLPKLIEEMKQTIGRYERAIEAAGEGSLENQMLARQLAGYRADMQRLGAAR